MSTSRSPLRGNDIRKQNEKLILGLILKNKYLSQSEAVNLTGLKPPTVLRIFTNLESEKLIKISKSKSIESDKRGRKPVYYKVNSKAAYAIGIDFCSTSASVIIVDFNREPVFEKFIEFDGPQDGHTIIKLLQNTIDCALIETKIDQKKILGIGIGAPGRVDISSGTVFYFDRIEGLTDYHLKDQMEEHYNTTIYVNNNCSVIAMNEYQYGIVSDSHALITLLIRSGVGGAFINEGRILTSNGITAMEVGHICIDNIGRQCECGELGCLESYLAEPAIIRDLQKIKKIKSFLEIDELIIKGGAEIEEFLKQKGEMLARGLKILSRTFNPDTFLIISRSPLFAKKISEYADEIVKVDSSRYNSKEILVKHSTYNPIDAGQGAANMVFADYFTIQ